MFHPVGSQPPSVYWRRRLAVLGSVAALVVLLVMTVKIITSGGDGSANAQGSPTTGATRASATTPASSRAPTSRASRTAPSRTHARTSASSKRTSAAPPPDCAAGALDVAAVAAKSSYQVGDQPVLELQVTNTGTRPCVQDLADAQVELKVYNGESRVWGSHDCKVEKGTADRVLPSRTPVRVAVTWSGLSSRPGCAGTRQRVGAGTYTLYASLAGKTGKAGQFTIG